MHSFEIRSLAEPGRSSFLRSSVRPPAERQEAAGNGRQCPRAAALWLLVAAAFLAEAKARQACVPPTERHRVVPKKKARTSRYERAAVGWVFAASDSVSLKRRS